MIRSRAVSTIVLALAAAGCHAGADGLQAAWLKRSFPAHGAEILGEASGRASALVAVLPPRGEEAVRLATSDDFAISVREIGARGEAAAEGGATAYARVDGASFWRASAGGYEEWLLLGPGRAAGPAAAWEIEGGSLAARGAAIEVLDEAGAPRLRITAPRAYAVSGRAVGARLSARAQRLELTLDGAAPGEEVLVDPAWTPTQLMTTARWTHTATRLLDGRVLVAGGALAAAQSTAEIYNPQADTWTPTAGEMPNPHGSHVAALLCDGTVLVAGGYGTGGGASPNANRYNPATDTWEAIKSMTYGHTFGTATVLDDCRVLVAGGYDARNQTELYNPTTGDWTVVPSTLSQTRFYHTATKLPDGRVVVAGGGYDDNLVWYTLKNVDVFDPVASAWSLLWFMNDERRSHAAALLPDGTLLVTGGSDQGQDDGTEAAVELDSTELYDPAVGLWELGPPLDQKRTTHTATVLENGAVLLAGGVDDTGSALSSTETYSGGAFSPSAAMNRNRYQHTATPLESGAVLIAGGLHQATAELYQLDQPGASCSGGSTCASGFCADGVCCDTACADGCSACDVAGAAGTCASPCLDATHAQGCAGGVCGDAGACEAQSCAPFLCTAAARGCATTCDTASDCAPGFACWMNHACVAPPDAAEGDAGSCALSPRDRGRGELLGTMGILAALALARRRR